MFSGKEQLFSEQREILKEDKCIEFSISRNSCIKKEQSLPLRSGEIWEPKFTSEAHSVTLCVSTDCRGSGGTSLPAHEPCSPASQAGSCSPQGPSHRAGATAPRSASPAPSHSPPAQPAGSLPSRPGPRWKMPEILKQKTHVPTDASYRFNRTHLTDRDTCMTSSSLTGGASGTSRGRKPLNPSEDGTHASKQTSSHHYTRAPGQGEAGP